MPELPEIHTITSDLIKYVQNAKILSVRIDQAYTKIDDKTAFTKTLQNKTVKKIRRVAKNIIWELDNNMYLLFHLAMTGRLLLRKKGFPLDKWKRVVIEMEKNNKSFEIRFCDMRMFGKAKILSEHELEMLINSYGPEPIQEGLTEESFHIRLQSKKTNIKNALLDQSVISGLGNVYATDALWIAKIHPQTQTLDINSNMAARLMKACILILNEGISNRGISMSDYVDLLGNKGEQQNHFRVYNKKSCLECETEIMFMQLNGRGTYFCPKCQTKDGNKQLL